MPRRYLTRCGMLAPLLFIFTAILGGALRPGYSHMADTISELFSPGSPNKLLLDALHTAFALLLILFGIGMLLFVRNSHYPSWLGYVGASVFILMGVVSVGTAAFFPQDPWGAPPTFPGRMHVILSGVIGLLSMLAMLLMGLWLIRTKLFPGFGIYSFITIGLVIISAGFYMSNQGSPIMGLAERITALIGFLWTFTLAAWMSSRERLNTNSL